jgi:hypothetical protein
MDQTQFNPTHGPRNGTDAREARHPLLKAPAGTTMGLRFRSNLEQTEPTAITWHGMVESLLAWRRQHAGDGPNWGNGLP